MKKLIASCILVCSVTACADASPQPAPVPVPVPVPVKIPEAAQQGGAAGGRANTSYLLFFDWDKAELNDTALANFRHIASEILATAPPYTLAVNGHTDSSGGTEYNMRLSEERAGTVRGLLERFGVPAPSISTFAFGETDLDVPTGDNVREPKNRRVEIFIE